MRRGDDREELVKTPCIVSGDGVESCVPLDCFIVAILSFTYLGSVIGSFHVFVDGSHRGFGAAGGGC